MESSHLDNRELTVLRTDKRLSWTLGKEVETQRAPVAHGSFSSLMKLEVKLREGGGRDDDNENVGWITVTGTMGDVSKGRKDVSC